MLFESGYKKWVFVFCFSWAAEQRHSPSGSRYDVQDIWTGEDIVNAIIISDTSDAEKYYSI